MTNTITQNEHISVSLFCFIMTAANVYTNVNIFGDISDKAAAVWIYLHSLGIRNVLTSLARPRSCPRM